MSAPVSDNPEEYLVIGPSGSGKTCLVGVLDHASKAEAPDRPVRFEVFPENDAMTKLVDDATQISLTGKLPWPPSNDVKSYQFVIRRRAEARSDPSGIRPEVLAQSRIRKHLFQLLDGPGEKLFPDKETDAPALSGDLDARDTGRGQLIELGRRSRGLIICLDASDETSGGKSSATSSPSSARWPPTTCCP